MHLGAHIYLQQHMFLPMLSKKNSTLGIWGNTVRAELAYLGLYPEV